MPRWLVPVCVPLGLWCVHNFFPLFFILLCCCGTIITDMLYSEADYYSQPCCCPQPPPPLASPRLQFSLLPPFWLCVPFATAIAYYWTKRNDTSFLIRRQWLHPRWFSFYFAFPIIHNGHFFPVRSSVIVCKQFGVWSGEPTRNGGWGGRIGRVFAAILP